MQIERRDPFTLKLHRLQKSLPEPDKKSPAWLAFIYSVRAGGILYPLLITPDGQIMDGGWRWRAAKILELAEVPVEVREESEAAVIMVESLLHRKQMTRGACVYLALGLLPDFVNAANSRRLANLRKGDKTGENPLKAPKFQNETSGNSTDESVIGLCERWGVDRNEYYRARRVRQLFDDNENLRREFEPDLLIGEKTLWNVISAIEGRNADQSKRESSKAESQLELFTDGLESLSKSGKFWNRFSSDQKETVLKKWCDAIAKWPDELRKALIERLEVAR